MDLCLEVTGEGAGLPAQAKYLALNSCPWGGGGEEYNDLPPDQEKGQPAFLPEAQSILPCSA